VIELKDSERFQRGLSGLLALLEAEAGGAFQVKSKPYRDVPLWTFSFGAESASGFGVGSISPSIAIVKDHLLITLTSTRAKKEIKRALGEESGVHALLKLAKPPPADATAIGYMDWAGLVHGLYGMGRTFLPLALAGRESPIDLSALPEPAVFTRFFQPTLYWSKRVPGGSYSRLESSFGPETWIALAGVGAGAAALFADDSTAAKDAVPTPEETSVSMWESAQSATEKVTRETLSYLATRLAVYRLEQGRFPAELPQLAEPTPAYPQGFVKAGTLQDGWGRPFAYRVLEDGAGFRMWSLGADGADQGGLGDDVVGQ